MSFGVIVIVGLWIALMWGALLVAQARLAGRTSLDSPGGLPTPWDELLGRGAALAVAAVSLLAVSRFLVWILPGDWVTRAVLVALAPPVAPLLFPPLRRKGIVVVPSFALVALSLVLTVVAIAGLAAFLVVRLVQQTQGIIGL